MEPTNTARPSALAHPLPRWRVPRSPRALAEPAVVGDFEAWPWHQVPRLPPFARADGRGGVRWQTAARVCFDATALAVRFDCDDDDAWGSFARRDEPLWQEEVVELFLAPGPQAPRRYFEFEVSPRGVLLDAVIENPTGRREDLRADFAWDAAGIRWGAGPRAPGRARAEAAADWWAVLVLPWEALGTNPLDTPEWRANLYRIERPRPLVLKVDAASPTPLLEPEYSAWSAPLTDPADFHRPERFGRWEF